MSSQQHEHQQERQERPVRGVRQVAGAAEPIQPNSQKPTRVYQLLEGIAEHEDFSEPHDPVTGRHPPKVYHKGERILSHIDLVKRFGPQKYALVGEGRRLRGSVVPGEVAPGQRSTPAPQGQVSSGKQVTRGTPQGSTVTGQFEEDEEQELFGDDVPAGHEEAGPDKVHQSESSQAQPMEEVTDEDLDNMTVAELRKYAASNKVDLQGATVKADIIKSIQDARGED